MRLPRGVSRYLAPATAALLFTSLAPATAGAAVTTYPTTYVAGSGGSDGNNCSSQQTPCATLTGALAETQPGGTIYVSGTITESAAASIGQDVTIAAAPGASTATIAGSTTGTTDGNGLLTIARSVTVTLQGLTFSNGNVSSGYGGGAVTNNAGGNLTVTDCTFTNNTSDFDGGAIDSADDGGSGTLTVADSKFSGNTAGNDGGAIDSADYYGNGTLTVTDSTFSGNTANYDGGAIDSGDLATGSATVNGSTFSGNTATYDGGAIDSADFFGSGTLVVSRSTLTGNSATNGGAVDTGDHSGDGTLVVADSTLAGGSATHASLIAAAAQESGYTTGTATTNLAADVLDGTCAQNASSWYDYGFSAATDASCLGSAPAHPDQLTPAAADLGTLASNGGPTQTLALLAGNPAIDLIPANTAFSVPAPGRPFTIGCPLTADQRGIGNPGAAGCDAGAIQYATQVVSFTSSAPGGATTGGAGYTPVASSTSGLPVSLAVDPATTNAACSISGGTVRFDNAGTCVIDAIASNPLNFAPAQAQQRIAVAAAAPAVTTATPVVTPKVRLTPRVLLLGGSRRVTGNRLAVRLRCAGATCTGAVRLVAVRTLVIRHGKRRVRRHRVVVIGVERFTMLAGSVRELRVLLNADGRHLLAVAREHRLAVTIHATATGSVQATSHETIWTAARRPHRGKRGH